MSDEFNINNDYEYYDHKKLEKLQDKRSMQWLKLYKKMMDARKKGDEKSLSKAREALMKHEEKDEIIKEKANNTGFFWC